MTLVNLRNDTPMRFAFSVTNDRLDSKMKSLLDPRYVKIITRIKTKDPGTNTESDKFIGHHPCTADDWAKFAPPSKAASVKFARI